MDARALLRATKAGAGGSSSAATASSQPAIMDRFASYNTKTGALRCAACQYMVIKHEALWSSHAASKSHRANVAAVLDKERREQDEKDRREAQEKEAAAAAEAEAQAGAERSTPGKRKAGADGQDGQLESQAGASSKKPRTEQDAVIESEWEKFQREVLGGESAAGSSGAGGDDNEYKRFAAATIEAAPVLRKPVAGDDEDDEAEAGGPAAAAEPRKTHAEIEAEQRAERERMEKEEILARYEEEVRIQQEGDERVAALRARLADLKGGRARGASTIAKALAKGKGKSKSKAPADSAA